MVRRASALAILRRPLRGEFRFALLFAAIAGTGSLLYAYPYAQGGVVARFMAGYLAAYASAAGAVLGVFDAGISVSGNYIHGRFPVQIVRDCDAMEVQILLGAAILAVPVAWRRRAVGLVVGALSVLFANLARICLLYFVGLKAPGWFEVLHREILPIVLIATAVGVFFAWTNWARRRDEVTADVPGR